MCFGPEAEEVRVSLRSWRLWFHLGRREAQKEGGSHPASSLDSELWVKGRCLSPVGACWNLEASFPSHSTKGPRGPWVDTEDLPWAPTLEDELVTLSSTRVSLGWVRPG